MRFLSIFQTLCLLMLMSGSTFLQALEITEVANFEVDESSTNTFASPVTMWRDKLFTANVEPASGLLSSPQTVVREYVVAGLNQLVNKNVVDPATAANKYHTQASIAADIDGYVHVVGNMHNEPWKYWLSEHHGSAERFNYRGEAYLQTEGLRELDPRSFGSAAIPGTQITYPRFHQDRKGELYISFRQALRPARDFKDRAYGLGLARYQRASKAWESLGAKPELAAEDYQGSPESLPNVIAYEPGMTLYYPSVYFDRRNALHMAWPWRLGIAGNAMLGFSYLRSADDKQWHDVSGAGVSMPLRFYNEVTGRQQTPLIADEQAPYFAYSSLWLDPDSRTPTLLRHSHRYGRHYLSYDQHAKHWGQSIASPNGASRIVADDKGNLYGFSTGLAIYQFQSGQWRELWHQPLTQPRECHVKVVVDYRHRAFLIHSQECDGQRVHLRVAYWATAAKAPNALGFGRS